MGWDGVNPVVCVSFVLCLVPWALLKRFERVVQTSRCQVKY